jgi:hypothetical protein
MSNFKNLKILLKKHYIIHSSASACAISATLPLWYGYTICIICQQEHYAVDCMNACVGAKDGRNLGEAVFGNFWMVDFGGCFENS